MKGIDDQQIDGKIIHSLLSSLVNEKDEVMQILLETIEIISKKNLKSILSILVSNDSPLNKKEDIFNEIIKRIVNNENSCKSLVSYLASCIYDDGNKSVSNSMISLSLKIFPMLGNAINETDDDTWSKLFIGIVKQTHSIDSPLFRSLFKIGQKNDQEDLYFYVKMTAKQHPTSLPLILSYFPEKSTKLIRKLSLVFALESIDYCHSFLEYSMMNDFDSFDQDDLEILIQIFNSIDKKIWMDLSNKFIKIIINFISKNDVNISLSSSIDDVVDFENVCNQSFSLKLLLRS